MQASVNEHSQLEVTIYAVWMKNRRNDASQTRMPCQKNIHTVQLLVHCSSGHSITNIAIVITGHFVTITDAATSVINVTYSLKIRRRTSLCIGG